MGALVCELREIGCRAGVDGALGVVGGNGVGKTSGESKGKSGEKRLCLQAGNDYELEWNVIRWNCEVVISLFTVVFPTNTSTTTTTTTTITIITSNTIYTITTTLNTIQWFR